MLSMTWEEELEEFRTYLRLERGLTGNSVKAYCNDIMKLVDFLSTSGEVVPPDAVTAEQFRGFMAWLGQNSISPRTQARIMSGVRSFYKSLIVAEKIEADPTEAVQTPKVGRKLPEVLSVEEIDAMEEAFDLGRSEGVRNLAIVETLYSCGLRVSELTDLRVSCLHLDKGYVRVEGKGRKERLIPIGQKAVKCIRDYVDNFRNESNIAPGHEDFLFISRLGKKLSRIMVFNIIKEAAAAAGITKTISPHTLRHSFATHLVDGGANLRAVQEMLGHESIMTTEIYTHLDNSYLLSTLVEHHPYREAQETVSPSGAEAGEGTQ